jgi:DNA-binding protein HU-beta
MATQAEFIDEFAGLAGITKAEADRVARSYAEAATKLAKGGFVTLPEFGRLKKVVRKARTGRNPQTGKAIKVPEKSYLALKIEV